MSRILVAALARNEAGKYWRSALAAWSEFADQIVVLDDSSTDETAKIAKDFGAIVQQRGTSTPAWGKEVVARQELYELAVGFANEDDYILWLDADMVPARDPRELLKTPVAGYAFPLYDLWGEDEHGRLLYRDDALWCAHQNPRVWMIKKPAPSFVPEWRYRGVHCGHLPANLHLHSLCLLPRSHALLHYGYANEQDREAKLAAYLKVSRQLSPEEWAHARTITDFEPNLRAILTEPRWRLTRAS